MKIRNFFRFKSIHTNIALGFSFLILCTTISLSYNAYRLSSSAVMNSSLAYTSQLISQVNTNIQTYIGNMQSISALVLENGDLQRYLSLNNPDTPEGAALKKQLNEFFHSIVSSRNDIASIAFIGSNGAAVSDRSDANLKDYNQLARQEWFKQAKNADGKVVISSSHVQHIYAHEYRWVVSISRLLKGTAGLPKSGVLLVDLNYNVINNLCQQILLGKRGYVFVLDPSGDLIYHPQQQLIYSHLKSEDIERILNSKDSKLESVQDKVKKIYTIRTTKFGWKIVGVTYPDELVGNKREIQFSSAMWGILSLLVALAISVILSFTLTKPIKNLESHMKQVEKGDFDTRVEIASPNEIGKLARTFNLMIAKIKELMNQIVAEQEMKRASELKALQAQIKPHFLYNTLDSIIWMAEMGKMDKVVEMTSALSRLFRSSIGKGEELVPISVELENIQNYLTIQSIRYKNKFTYEIDVDPAILNCKILKIILQPLVENAIYHGIKHKIDIGHIRITGQKADGMVRIAVSDDGPGMDTARIKAVLAAPWTQEEGKSVGLSNVNHRLQLYFGESYGLDFTSEPDDGTTVFVQFPEIT